MPVKKKCYASKNYASKKEKKLVEKEREQKRVNYASIK